MAPFTRDAAQEAIEGKVGDILRWLGLDPNAEGLKDTPRRFAKYLLGYCQPFDAAELLKQGFTNPSGHSELIAQSGIPFKMICEHHLLPATGYAAIGYISNRRVVGLSKLTRLVRAVGTERPSLQEAIGDRIASILWEHLEPRGVIVVLKAEHTCMSCRGVAVAGVQTITSSVRGVFRDVPQARDEFFNVIKLGR